MGLTANDIAALGPDARRQIALAIIKDEKQKRTLREKKNKYKAKKTAYNGETFDSSKEADRFGELLLMQSAGKIFDLQRQVKFELIPPQERPDGKREFPVHYIADFTFTDSKGYHVEDVKGYRKGAAYREFVIKRKLMLQRYGIAVEEI